MVRMKRSGDCSKDVELGSNLHIITVEQSASPALLSFQHHQGKLHCPSLLSEEAPSTFYLLMVTL